MNRLRNPKIGLGLMILALTLLSFVPVQPARADIAPPAEPPGSNISPADSTQVQMLAETVQIQVQPVAYQSRPRLAAEFALASVKASFSMRNQGEAAEQLQVRFPLMDPSGMGDGFGHYPEIQDIQVRVNEKATTTRRVTTPTPNTWDQSAPPIAWAAFDVSFPAGRKVNIDVQYTLQPTGYFPVAEFDYILETGAGWYGSIGSADIILSLPYDVNSQNLLYGDYNTTPGGQVNGQQITWHYADLEPTRDDNLRIDIMDPKTWMDLLQARQAVQANAGDSNAWQSLAQAAGNAAQDKSGKGWLRSDPGGQVLALESMGAYEQVLAARPKDPGLWAGYENLILRIVMQDYPTLDRQPTATDAHFQKLVEAVNQVLTLDPNNEAVQSDAQWVASTFPSVVKQNSDGSLSLVQAVPVVTGTPVPALSPTPSSTPLPMRTPTALHTATQVVLATTPAPTPSPALAQFSTPGATPPGTAVEAAPVTPVSSTPSASLPATFVAVAFLVGLCVIVLVALSGVGLAVWYLRREVKSPQNSGRITKNDGSP